MAGIYLNCLVERGGGVTNKVLIDVVIVVHNLPENACGAGRYNQSGDK